MEPWVERKERGVGIIQVALANFVEKFVETFFGRGAFVFVDTDGENNLVVFGGDAFVGFTAAGGVDFPASGVLELVASGTVVGLPDHIEEDKFGDNGGEEEETENDKIDTGGKRFGLFWGGH